MPPSDARIAEIVLTGGSCAGKTKALTDLSAELRRAGLRVITVPEVATMIITGGIPDIGTIAREDGEAYCRFQAEVFRTHRSLRRSAQAMAASFREQLVVILFDRGEMDGIAYHAHDCFEDLAGAEGLSVADIRDSYTAVMHLVTTADGAEDAYSSANNSARWDNAAEARYFDSKILAAWSGHPHHIVLDNRSDYAGKLQRLLAATLQVVDGPGQLQIELPEPSADQTVSDNQLGLDLVGTPLGSGALPVPA